MKRIMPPEVKLHFIDTPDSERRLQIAYSRIFEIARKNLIEKKLKKKKSNRTTM